MCADIYALKATRRTLYYVREVETSACNILMGCDAHNGLLECKVWEGCTVGDLVKSLQRFIKAEFVAIWQMSSILPHDAPMPDLRNIQGLVLCQRLSTAPRTEEDEIRRELVKHRRFACNRLQTILQHGSFDVLNIGRLGKNVLVLVGLPEYVEALIEVQQELHKLTPHLKDRILIETNYQESHYLAFAVAQDDTHSTLSFIVEGQVVSEVDSGSVQRKRAACTTAHHFDVSPTGAFWLHSFGDNDVAPPGAIGRVLQHDATNDVVFALVADVPVGCDRSTMMWLPGGQDELTPYADEIDNYETAEPLNLGQTAYLRGHYTKSVLEYLGTSVNCFNGCTDRPVFLFAGSAQPGDSGSPVTDDDGGIIYGILRKAKYDSDRRCMILRVIPSFRLVSSLNIAFASWRLWLRFPTDGIFNRHGFRYIQSISACSGH